MMINPRTVRESRDGVKFVRISLTIVDPDGRDGRAIVEMIGFNRESINDRMHVEIRREQSNYWFEYWTQQFTQMWNMAREP